MSQDKIANLERAIKREKAARKKAELILEKKAAELHDANRRLEKSYSELEILLNNKDSQLQGVFENIVDSYCIMDLSGNILKMNDAASTLLGFENDKIDYNLIKMVDASDYNKVANSFKKLLKEGTLTNFEIKITTNLNIEKLIHVNASIIYDNGLAAAAQGIIRDITKEREAENKLIESEDRLATLILNLDEGVLLEDENRKIIVTNKRFCEIFHIPANPHDLVGQDCSNSAEQSKFLFENPNEFVEQINTTLLARKIVLGEELIMTDGRIFDRDYIPIIRNGQHKGHLWKYKDLTLKRNYRVSIEAQRLKYRSIITNMNLGLVEVDTEDRILMVNQSFLEMCGYPEKELIGKISSDIFKTDTDINTITGENSKRHKAPSNSYELDVKTKQGELRHWLISEAPNYNLNGNVVGSIGVHLDITNLKSLEIQKENLLIELEKSNNELQEYAHIVSHDLKSPLRSINALVNWLKEDNKGKLDELSVRNFDLIDITLEKMEHLISDILDYSSIGSGGSEKIIINTNELVKDLLKITYIPEHITVNIINTLPFVMGHKTKLQQLFQNLISNSIKFIDKEKGVINISVEELKDYYQFSIEDNGIGIEEQFYSKIFKVFHSLKKSKDSTGIGLAIVQKIVELHHGKVWLTSEPNIRTTFFFTLKK